MTTGSGKAPRVRCGCVAGIFGATATLALCTLSADPALAQDGSARSASGSPVAANEQSEPVLSDIVVTAQRREERLQDVPIAVTAIGADTMRAAGIDRIADLTKLAPSLTFVELTFSQNLGIRGIFSGENQGLEQSVGTYVDGISRGRPFQARIPFLDVERVEVLRGPQSILFGKNSVAGALNVTTARPTASFEGYASTELTQYETNLQAIQAEGAISGPLTDTLRFRIAGRTNDSDGYMKNNETGGGVPALTERQIRGVLAYAPTDRLRLTLKGEYDFYKRKGLPEETADETPAVAGPFAGLTYARILASFGQPQSVLDNVGNWQTSATGTRSVNRAKEFVLTANRKFDDFDVTSISGYSGYGYHDYFDADFTAANVFGVQSRETYNQYSQELRLDSAKGGTLDYTAGLYLESNAFTYDEQALTFPTGSIGIPIFNSVAPGLGSLFENAQLVRHVRQTNNTLSPFAQATYHLNARLRLVGGLRYSWGEKRATREVGVTKDGFPAGAATLDAFSDVFNVNAHSISGKRTDTAWLPSVTLEGNPTSDILAYVSWKRGAKSGGFDVRSNNLPFLAPGLSARAIGSFEFRNETNDTFEAGTKISIGRRAEINLAAYYEDFKDLQVSLYDGGLGYNVGNAASARIKGLELDSRWSITRELSARGALAYTDFRFGTFYGLCYVGQVPDSPDGTRCDYRGKSNQYVPKWAGNLALTWQRDIFDDLRLTVGADSKFSSSYFAQGDLNPLQRQKGYALFDARVGVGAASGNWDIGLNVRNVTNHYVVAFASNTPLAASSFGAPSYLHLPLPPRSFVLQLRTRF